LRQGFEPNANLLGKQTLQYTPRPEKETEEVVKSFGFLDHPFTFDRDQLALFLQTLHNVVQGDGDGDDSGLENGI
jgi:hypothetical protein